MPPVTWLIDDVLLRGTLTESLPQVIRDAGYPCIIANAETAPPSLPGPVILYGPHEFIERVRDRYKPGAYCNDTRLKCSAWLEHYNDIALNAGAQFMMLHDVPALSPQDAFIRPDAGDKSFTGRLLRKNTWQDDCAELARHKNVKVLLSAVHDIIAEYRFFIADARVISGSQYRRNERLDMRIDVMPAAQDLAEIIAACDWQPDLCYVADIAETPDGMKLIEFNSFSCSGFYACDQTSVVRAVSAAALGTASHPA